MWFFHPTFIVILRPNCHDWSKPVSDIAPKRCKPWLPRVQFGCRSIGNTHLVFLDFCAFLPLTELKWSPTIRPKSRRPFSARSKGRDVNQVWPTRCSHVAVWVWDGPANALLFDASALPHNRRPYPVMLPDASVFIFCSQLSRHLAISTSARSRFIRCTRTGRRRKMATNVWVAFLAKIASTWVWVATRVNIRVPSQY